MRRLARWKERRARAAFLFVKRNDSADTFRAGRPWVETGLPYCPAPFRSPNEWLARVSVGRQYMWTMTWSEGGKETKMSSLESCTRRTFFDVYWQKKTRVSC